MTRRFTLLIFGTLILALIAACGGSEATGELEFRANGEDFVRQGFVSKDSWRITFDNVYVTLTDVAAYQTNPPYDASDGAEIEGDSVMLPETYTIDLAAGSADADPILVGAREDAPAGQYNAVSWRMIPATEGDAAGYTVMLVGTAEKDGEVIDFSLKFDDDFQYRCGEFVGDARKGILAAGETADVELTFHFDHVFGDADAPMDDALNVDALGFDPLAALARDGMLDMETADLEAGLSAEEFATLMDTLQTLGHVGEGHCYEAVGGYTGHSE